MKTIATIATLLVAGNVHAVTVCTDASGKKTYTDFDDCSKLNLQADRKISYIGTKPKHCGDLKKNAETLNQLADDHRPGGKTQHLASGAVANLVGRQAKEVENRYEKECVRQ